MCILEAISVERPWGWQREGYVRRSKMKWIPEVAKKCTDEPHCPEGDARELVWRMCCQDPYQRINLSSARNILEQVWIKHTSDLSQPELESTSSFDEYDCGRVKELWLKVLVHMEKCDHIQYHREFVELRKLRELMQDTKHRSMLFTRFHSLLIDCYRVIKMSPEQSRMVGLSSTRVTSNSLYAFQWRVNSLMTSLGEAEAGKKREERWQKQRKEQIEGFVSGVSDPFFC
ncbi:hypothetical protein GQ600_25576 [Phytophthora cactorum]|nr:hypothetical protein GQ600_25576 [Phytophthora cactorum]